MIKCQLAWNYHVNSLGNRSFLKKNSVLDVFYIFRKQKYLLDGRSSHLWKYPNLLQKSYLILQLCVLKMTWKCIVKNVDVQLQNKARRHCFDFTKLIMPKWKLFSKILIWSYFFVELRSGIAEVIFYGEEHNTAFENVIKSPLKLWCFLLIEIIVVRKSLTW